MHLGQAQGIPVVGTGSKRRWGQTLFEAPTRLWCCQWVEKSILRDFFCGNSHDATFLNDY